MISVILQPKVWLTLEHKNERECKIKSNLFDQGLLIVRIGLQTIAKPFLSYNNYILLKFGENWEDLRSQTRTRAK